MQDRVLPQALLIKGGFGWIVDMSRSRPTPATKKKRKPFRISSMVGLPIEISNRFLRDYVAVFQIAKQCKTRSCHKPSFSKEGLGGL